MFLASDEIDDTGKPAQGLLFSSVFFEILICSLRLVKLVTLVSLSKGFFLWFALYFLYPGLWDLGFGTWGLRSGNWDLGSGTRGLGSGI